MCLDQGADLHMAQLMPYSLSLASVNPDWFYLLGLPCWCLLTRVVQDKIQEGRKMVVCVRVYVHACMCVCVITSFCFW